MTLDGAREILEVQAGFGGRCNANSAEPILSKVMREHGQATVDGPIVGPGRERLFGFRPGTRRESGIAHALKQQYDESSRKLAFSLPLLAFSLESTDPELTAES